MLSGPSGPGQKDWMTFTFKLERLDGARAEPATIKVTRGAWPAPGCSDLHPGPASPRHPYRRVLG
jgi:hypothetical protein